MGATSDVAAALRQRGIRPSELWFGILAGPIAFAAALTIRYAAVQWACLADRGIVLQAITVAALLLTLAGGWTSFRALGRTPADARTDQLQPFAIARFMALLGIGLSALFVVVTIANDLPQWVLSACR